MKLHLHFVLFIFLNQNHNFTNKAVLKTTFFGQKLRGNSTTKVNLNNEFSD